MRAIAAAVVFTAAGLLSGCVADLPAKTVEARYATPASQFMTLKDGSRIHYRDEGPREAPALVLLHGSNDALFTWDGWAGELSKTYRVIRFDFPGHGLTGPTPVARYDAERYAAVIDEVTRG
jgi:alpha-beta hydrolase superfamily lysophospholipase